MLKNKKIKSLIIAIIALFILALLSGVFVLGLFKYYDYLKADQAKIKPSAFTASIITDGEELQINSWESKRDKKNYLFFPSDADLNKVAINCNGALEIDDKSIKSGETTDLLSQSDEHIIKIDGKKYKTVVIQNRNVPSIHISTESGSLDAIYSDKSHKEKADIQIFNNGDIVLSDTLKHIKCRGEASWLLPQKSFNIKFKKKTDLFDMGRAKKYSLIALMDDSSLIRNNIALSLADISGLDYTSKYQITDLFINGNYLGNYLIVESVEIKSNRVDIHNLEKENELANPDVDFETLDILTNAIDLNSLENGTKRWVDIKNNPTNIKSGYLLEIELGERFVREPSGFITNNGQPVVISSPEFSTENEVNYISSFYQEFEDAVLSPNGYNSLGKHYTSYIDISSFAKMYIIQELGKNLDANDTSTYMYLDDSGLLKAGPIWDYDNTFSNTQNPSEWKICFNGFYKLLFKHQDFRNEVYNIWHSEMKQSVKDIFTLIDNSEKLYEKSSYIHSVRWDSFNTNDESENTEAYIKSLNNIKIFINESINLFDSIEKDSTAIFYDSNGEADYAHQGIISPNDNKITVADNYYTSDYDFLGWNTNADGSGENYKPNDILNIKDETVTLYAQWGNQNKVKKVKNKLNYYVTKAFGSIKKRINGIKNF